MSDNLIKAYKFMVFKEWLKDPDEIELMVMHRACLLSMYYKIVPHVDDDSIIDCFLLAPEFVQYIGSTAKAKKAIKSLVAAGILDKPEDQSYKDLKVYKLNPGVRPKSVLKKYKKDLRDKLDLTGAEAFYGHTCTVISELVA